MYFRKYTPDHDGFSSLTFAATDTTSGALARTLHLLAQHKDVQTKVRHEIRQARKENGGEDIPHDTLVTSPSLRGIVLIWTKVSENFG